MAYQLIKSVQNPKVKAELRLRNNKYRRQMAAFGVEGLREVQHALAGGFKPLGMFYCPELMPVEPGTLIKEVVKANAEVEIYQVSPPIFAKLTLRTRVDGVWLRFAAPAAKLADVDLPANPLILVCEDLEKPGNVGAVVRTAVGAGCNLCVVLNEAADLYQPSIVRASLGWVFRLPTVGATPEALLKFCAEKNIQVYTALISNKAQVYTDVSWRGPSAIVVGSEAKGLNQWWQAQCVTHVRIPMQAGLDSLNVSVAAALLMYEAARQRSRDCRSRIADRGRI